MKILSGDFIGISLRTSTVQEYHCFLYRIPIISSVTGLLPPWPGFKPGSSHVGFVVNKVALGQVFSMYFGSPANLHSTNFSIITLTYHPGLVP
jgi:hypothetical protein